MYSHLLCAKCVGKTYKEYCKDCIKVNRGARKAKWYSAKKKNKAIAQTDTVQLNQPNSTMQDSDESGDCNDNNGIVGSDSIVKKRSIYADLFCITCQQKPLKEICQKCMKKYNSAKSINSYSLTLEHSGEVCQTASF